MVIDSDREFQCKLEESSANQRQQHHDALQRAVEQHEYVRKSAETAKRRAEAEEELERRRREDEEMLALRRLERQKHEQELRRAQELRDAEAQRIARDQERLRIEREEKERIELDAKRALEAKERAEREVQRVREEEQRKAAQAEVDRKAKEAAEAAKKTSLQPPQSVPSTVAPSNTTPQAAPTSSQSSTSDNSEPEHERYLQIHKELKALRRAARNEKALKSQMGDLRRQITKSLGQLTLGKGVNKQPVCFPLTTPFLSFELSCLLPLWVSPENFSNHMVYRRKQYAARSARRSSMQHLQWTFASFLLHRQAAFQTPRHRFLCFWCIS